MGTPRMHTGGHLMHRRVPIILVKCSFKVGEHGVANPTTELWEQAAPAVEALASGVQASRVRCNQCRDVMGRDELFGRDLKTIACPNCYSSDLSVIEVRFELGWFDARRK